MTATTVQSATESCIFCQIIRGEARAAVLYSDSRVIAFVPIDPVTAGHTILAPTVHYENLFDITDESLYSVMRAAKTIAAELRAKYGATGVNLLHATGRDAQQSVFHFHLHVVPRYFEDGLDLWLGTRL